ncbi:RodZ domain-containing protein [Proteinivorax tanatarense]|uniref:RodZ domain-containing protein n=1 Tax=Proteinivorax tanatarense TaxID=1260629 RepID=A0AAU7VRY7_9FIRM
MSLLIKAFHLLTLVNGGDLINLLEIGKKLQEARQEKGLTVEDICSKTKMKKGQVVALEKGDENALPPKTYIKGFIKLYAKEVGLDYRELVGTTTTETKNSRTKRSKKTEPIKRRTYESSFDFKGVIFLTVFVLIIGFSAYLTANYFLSSSEPIGVDLEEDTYSEKEELDESKSDEMQDDDESETSETHDNDETEHPESDDELDEDNDNGEDKAIVIDEDNDDNNYYYSITSHEAVTLKISFTEQCWVSVIVDGETVHVDTHNPEDIYEVNFEESAEVRVGYPQGIQFYVNEQEINFFEGNNPKDAYFEIIVDEE